jgi:plastocyanin
MFKKLGAAFVLVAAVTLGLTGGGAPVHAGGGCHQVPGGFTDAASSTVAIDACKFVPAVVRIQPGDAIKWTNNDPVDHMVAGVAGSWGDSTGYTQGASVSYAFPEAGVYPYFCELHPGMVGAVVVGNAAAGSADTGEGVLAVSAVGAGAADAPAAASVPDDRGGDGFGLAAFAVVAVALALIGGAALLVGLRLSGKLQKV